MKSFLPNWKVVLLSISLAAILWFLNAMNKNYTTSVELPLVIQYDTTRYIQTEENSPTFQANVTGTGWQLLLVNMGYDVEPCVVEVKELPISGKVGASSLFQEVSQHLPKLKVNYVHKELLETGLEDRLIKKVRLSYDSDKLKISNLIEFTSAPVFTPDSVTINGPLSELQSVDSVVIDSVVVLNQSDTSVIFKSDLTTLFSKHVSISENEINGQLAIQTYELGSLEEIRVEVMNRKKDFAFELVDSLATISFQKPKNIPDRAFKDVQLFIDAKEASDTSTRLKIYFIAPDELRSFKITPGKARIRVR